MKCTRPMVDVEGKLVEVGDIIYRPIFSVLEPSYVLRITPYAIYVSVKKVIYSGKDNRMLQEIIIQILMIML